MSLVPRDPRYGSYSFMCKLQCKLLNYLLKQRIHPKQNKNHRLNIESGSFGYLAAFAENQLAKCLRAADKIQHVYVYFTALRLFRPL